MKKVGKEVLFIPAKENAHRNGEGDFIRLKDGRIMFAYSEFHGDHWGNNAPCHIVALFSSDEGETWGDKKVLAEPEGPSINFICVSLLRMNNEDIAMTYMERYLSSDGDLCTRIWLRRTSDEFETLSDGINCVGDERHHFGLENARLVRTKSGRIIIPVHAHSVSGMNIDLKGVTRFYFSDDDGNTFYDSKIRLEHPFGDTTEGLNDPAIIEMENGRLFCYFRTASGSQFESFSQDDGLTWTTPRPSMLFTSPRSPMIVRHLNNDKTIAVFNPKIDYGEEHKGTWSRTPLAAYICEGKGENFWKNASFYMLEDDATCGYCYPTVFSGDDYFLCAYYHSNHSDYCLNSCKIIKVDFSELS